MREQVLQLAMKTLDSLNRVDSNKVAKALGITRKQVTNHVCHLRYQGKLPPLVTPNAKPPGVLRRNRITASGTKVGSLSDIFGNLSDDQARWLANQVPEGSSVAELISAIVQDAYFEEKETE